MADNKEIKSKEHTRTYRSTSPSKTSYTEAERGSSLARRASASPLSVINSPFSLMRRMAEDMDRIFSDFGYGRSLTGSDLYTEPSGTSQTIWAPQVELFKREDKLVVRADLPGLDKDSVKVEVEDDALTISGERKNEFEEKRDDYYRSERSYGRFFRVIPLPEGVDEDQIAASYKDGVLEVTVPVPQVSERTRKQIDIK